MSPVEIQMSVNALFFSSICAIMLFVANEFFAWQSPKYHQINPFLYTWKMIKTMKLWWTEILPMRWDRHWKWDYINSQPWTHNFSSAGKKKLSFLDHSPEKLAFSHSCTHPPSQLASDVKGYFIVKWIYYFL